MRVGDKVVLSAEGHATLVGSALCGSRRPVKEEFVQIIEIYVGDDGKTRIRDYTPEEFADMAHMITGPVDVPLPSSSSNRPGGFFVDWHPANPDLGTRAIVCLTGVSEYEAEDGGWRRLMPGDLVLLNDKAGKGRRFRVHGSESRLPFFSIWNHE